MMKKLIWLFPLLTFSLSAAGHGYGLRPGAVEASGFVGVGILPYELGTHPGYGGGAAIGLNRYVAADVQAGYVKADPNWLFPGGVGVTDVTGGFELIAPTGRIQPYGVVGVGVAHFGYQGWGESKLALSYGGGIRGYVTRNFGIRSEVRAVKAHDYKTYGRAAFGVFYQFGE